MNRLFCFIISASFILAACSTVTPAPTIAPLATPASLTATPTPPRPTATSTATLIPTLTPLPSPTPLPPLNTATQHRLGAWSPDSRYLTYWSYTPDDITRNPVEGSSIAPFGTLHVLDAQTGEECQYPQDNNLGLNFNFWHAWSPDGRLLTLAASGQVVVLDRPCGDHPTVYAAPEQPACLVTNPDASESCSPGNTRRGLTTWSGTAYTTTVVNIATGQTEMVIPYLFSADGLGTFPGPQWLSADWLLIYRTDTGPLLVTVSDKTIQPIATLFGLTGAASQSATGIGGQAGQFHILLADYGSDYTQSRVWLYHSENGVVEELLYAYAYFSPNGRWLDLQRSVTVNGYERYERWFRPLDPPNREARQYTTTTDQAYPGWSHDWTRVAVASPELLNIISDVTITVRTMPADQVLQTWRVGAYTFSPFLFSPDNHFLAAIGWAPQKQETALFVFRLP